MNNEQDTNNVPRTTHQKHPEKYKTITVFHTNEKIIKALKIIAIQEGATYQSIVEEALATWLKWMRKAERAEAIAERLAEKEVKLAEASALLADIIKERKKRKYGKVWQAKQRATTRRIMKTKFPGMKFPPLKPKKKSPV